MKKILLALLLMACAFVAAPRQADATCDAYCTKLESYSPTLYYRLDETSGTTAFNLGSASGCNLTNNGDYTQGVAGLIPGTKDTAYTYGSAHNAGSSYTSPNNGTCTAPYVSNTTIVFAYEISAATYSFVYFYEMRFAQNSLGMCYSPVGGSNYCVSPALYPTFGVPHLFVAEIPATGNITISVDGSTLASVGSGADFCGYSGPGSGDCSFALGAGAQPAVSGYCGLASTSQCTVDEVALYAGTLLTQAEINSIWSCFETCLLAPGTSMFFGEWGRH